MEPIRSLYCELIYLFVNKMSPIQQSVSHMGRLKCQLLLMFAYYVCTDECIQTLTARSFVLTQFQMQIEVIMIVMWDSAQPVSLVM